MIAYLMAAGLAIRLRPVTEKFPKCLLPVLGAPILEHWIAAIAKSGEFEEIRVNVHHCADQVMRWIWKYCEMHPDARVRIVDERTGMLGTAGTLFWHADTDQDLMVAYSDTYSRKFLKNIKKLARDWKDDPDPPLAGLVTFPVPGDESAGTVETDPDGVIVSFKEKSGDGLAAWAGMLFARREFLNQIRREDFDLARDVLPRLCGKMRVIAHVDAYDIGRGLAEYEHINSKP